MTIKVNNVNIAGNTEYSNFSGASSSQNGTKGLVPAPLIADKDKYLKGNGSWNSLTLSDITDITATANEVNYCDGVTSNIQTQLNNKQEAETAVTHTVDTSVGSVTQPCYIDSTGSATVCTSYSNYHDDTKADKLYQDYKSCDNGTIELEDNKNVYNHSNITEAITFVFDNTALTKSSTNFTTFELIFNMSTVSSITFPSSVTWLNNESPDMTATGIYMFSFRQSPNTSTWLGCLEGRW